jgi:sigma-B regulation protein RsbU (phosphoserine phosphatase)
MNSMMAVQDMDYIEKVFKETREIYYSMPPELHEEFYQEIEDVHKSCFGSLADADYNRAKELMAVFQKNAGAVNMMMFFPDPEADNLVFVLDGDTGEYAYPPGGWLKYDDADKEAVEKDVREIERTCESDWMLDIIAFGQGGFYAADYTKVYSKDGELLGYVDAEIDISEFVRGIIRFLIVLIPVAALTVFLLAFLTSKMLRKHIISYLNELSDAAVAYTERDNTAIDETTESVFESLDIKTADEMENLWLSMTGMEADVKDSIVRLRKMTAEKEYAEAELSIASQIQSGMLPSKFPDDSRFRLYASMDPAKEVGGDLYDFFMIDDDHLAVVIADVSGKGVSASLFMVTSKNLIKSQAEKGVQDPAEMFNHVNRQLMEVNKAHMFVTAWLGILKLSTGELVYVDAGHEYPALRRKGGLFEVIKDIHSVPLAVKKKMTFESGSFTLNAGDTLFVYTDGVPEANNTEGRMMGKERMLEALNSMPDADPETIINNVKSAVEDFSKDAPQFDDTTMMCLRYLGSYASRVE